MKKKNILLLIIAFVIVAILIQGLFCLHPKYRFFQANWSAGEILTYIGTVFLGVIAILQNAKYKESNDEEQEKLRKLADDANQLSFISKVIEYELVKKEKLECCIDSFHNLANTQRILETLLDGNVDVEKVMLFEKELDDSFLVLHELLHNVAQDEKDTQYLKGVEEMNKQLKNAIVILKPYFGKNMPDNAISNMEECLGLIQDQKNQIERLKNSFLLKKQQQLNKLVYERTGDLMDIKAIY